MKIFHVSDVLTVTTGRLVSNRHMDGVYEILNFITGDELFTHQLPRAMKECEPWLRTQFPQLFPDNFLMAGLLGGLDSILETGKHDTREQSGERIVRWVESVRLAMQIPEHLPVYEMGADMHTRIDPIEEAEAMFGKDRVIVVAPEEPAA